jgi:hypothetical protein
MKKLVVLSVALVCAAAGSARAQVSVEEFNKLKDRVESLEKRILDKLDVIDNRLRDNDAKIRDLVRQDAANPGRAVLDLMGNMERSAAFRADVDRITTGRLVIDNPTAFDQYMYINGTLWRVIPGRSSAPVNRGVVTVQRPGSASEVLGDWQFDAARGFYLTYRMPAASPTVVGYPLSMEAYSPVVYWP